MDTQWILIISLVILTVILLLLLLRFFLPKPMLAYRILGRVLNQSTRQGVAGLRVEAWDKDLMVDVPVGSAVTDTTGRFRITFTSSQFQAWFGDWLRAPSKITDRDTLNQTIVRKNPQ